MWFKVAMGLKKISSHKWVYSSKEVPNREDLASLLGCKMVKFTTYLGLPLGISFKLWVVWEVVEERFIRRLAMWKRQISFKGWKANADQKYYV